MNPKNLYSKICETIADYVSFVTSKNRQNGAIAVQKELVTLKVYASVLFKVCVCFSNYKAMRRVTSVDTSSFDKPEVTHWKHVNRHIAMEKSTNARSTIAQNLRPVFNGGGGGGR